MDNKEIIKNVYPISFSGGGWLGICYYIGALKYLISGGIIKHNLITLGTSAGAWAAVLLLYIKYSIEIKKEEFSIDEFKKKIFSFLDSCGSIPFLCEKNARLFFEKMIPSDDIEFIKYIRNKIFISISKIKFFYLKNKLLEPKTYEELIDSLIKSSMIPIMIGTDYRNLDGGLTNNQPIYNDKTLKINCLYKLKADIYPDKYINPIYIFKVPCNNTREYYIDMGFRTCRNFFEADF